MLPTTYTSNALNQYSATAMYTTSGTRTFAAGNQFAYDLDGNLLSIAVSGDANRDGVVSLGGLPAPQPPAMRFKRRGP